MKKHLIVWSMLLLVLTLASQPSQFAQNTSTGVQEPDMQRRASTVGLVRTINTAEVVEHTTYGSFASWQTLLAHQQEYLNKWLTKFYSRDPSVQFGSGPEILPGWNLRLTVQADGSGWVVLLEDAKDKNGYAALSDERGIIWECKHLQVTAPQQGR